MESVLYELFSGDYDITLKPDKKQQELCAQLCVEADKIQAAFGDAFLDRLCELEGEREDWRSYQYYRSLCELEGEREDWRSYQYYRSGFLLGARLMLEALGL